MQKSDKKFDVIVVGGGPAGMIAAGRAAELGASVLLIEKNSKLGKKLLITGGGRCNITNAELDVRKMVSKYGVKGKALFGSFSRFGVEDSIRFFEQRGLKIKVEAEKRVFPVTNKAEDVWKVFLDYLKEGKVKILFNSSVSKILHNQTQITGVQVGKEVFTATNYIIATGGKSRPETGSTGEGFIWMKALKHTVEESDPALVPVKVSDEWVWELSGLSFPNAKITVLQDGKKQESKTGKMLFTHFGLSGPLVLNLSKNIAELYKYAPVALEIDLRPDLELADFDKAVLANFAKFLNKKLKNSLGEIIPPKMIPVVLKQVEIDPEKEVNLVSRDERLRLVKFLKAIPMNVSGFLGVEKAVVTSGGVSLKEIDFKTMQSKLFSNLYLAGDILNFDRPSGGFSLQICWTTGYLAGQNAAETSINRLT